jgi:hypothetical protein
MAAGGLEPSGIPLGSVLKDPAFNLKASDLVKVIMPPLPSDCPRDQCEMKLRTVMRIDIDARLPRFLPIRWP